MEFIAFSAKRIYSTWDSKGKILPFVHLICYIYNETYICLSWSLPWTLIIDLIIFLQRDVSSWVLLIKYIITPKPLFRHFHRRHFPCCYNLINIFIEMKQPKIYDLPQAFFENVSNRGTKSGHQFSSSVFTCEYKWFTFF